jgi:transcriptional regulator with XRE-family HTH domain
MSLGERIKRLRERCGWNQRELTRRAQSVMPGFID